MIDHTLPDRTNSIPTKQNIGRMTQTTIWLFMVSLVAIHQTAGAENLDHDLTSIRLHVIPYPQEVLIGGDPFVFDELVYIALDQDHSEQDAFTASELVSDLAHEFNINSVPGNQRSTRSIILTHRDVPARLGEQGYQITVDTEKVIISANSAAGLFYGCQTMLQIIRRGRRAPEIPGLTITDWPDIPQRAVHYDTKHHQDKMSYVKGFIRDMARYKINMLVWEWEDKFAYPSHKEIGAPGAFTMDEMQALTRYAQNHHIQIVPLVQGLGHVSYILKWPQHHHLREIDASNWEFCPLKEGSYELLFDLWDDAIAATPNSEYIHIGSDETFELGMCGNCKKKSEELGKSGLYLLFVNRAAEYLKKTGRKVMVWERPMGWEMSNSPSIGITPSPGMVFTESYDYNTADFQYVREAKAHGYQTYAYDPNPGIEHLFLPYFYRIRGGQRVTGSLENSYNFLTSAALSQAFDGMINTSWDDSGLHNQFWMLSFVTSAEYSWSGAHPGLQQFRESFFKNYYGNSAINMDELFALLNEGSYYFSSTFERNVWHHGEIGKTHLPDLPRGDNIEFDPYWNSEYHEMLLQSQDQLSKMGRASQIIENNKKRSVKNQYDLDLFQSIIQLIRHTCLTYMDLSNLEYAITEAHRANYIDRKRAYDAMEKGVVILENSLERRQQVFSELKVTWEKSRLPKGMSTEYSNYFFIQDRARHFANRTKDMTYLIYDEQMLDMEGYLEDLKAYMEYYKVKIIEAEQ